jgi:hypothetical protein
MFRVDDVPTEIWQRILSYALVGDGSHKHPTSSIINDAGLERQVPSVVVLGSVCRHWRYASTLMVEHFLTAEFHTVDSLRLMALMLSDEDRHVRVPIRLSLDLRDQPFRPSVIKDLLMYILDISQKRGLTLRILMLRDCDSILMSKLLRPVLQELIARGLIRLYLISPAMDRLMLTTISELFDTVKKYRCPVFLTFTQWSVDIEVESDAFAMLMRKLEAIMEIGMVIDFNNTEFETMADLEHDLRIYAWMRSNLPAHLRINVRQT